GGFYDAIKRHADAAKIREETLTLRKAKLGDSHPDTLESMRDLTDSYFALERYADALKLYDETKALKHARLNPDRGDSLQTVFRISYCLVKAERSAGALPIIDDLLERLVRLRAQPATIYATVALRREHFEKRKDIPGCRATAEMWEKLGHKD